jgi:hypothetical protein
MSQTASPGSPQLEVLACDVVAVGDSVDVTAGSVSTRGVIVAIGPSSLVMSLPGAIEPRVTAFSLTRTDLDGVAWTAECSGRVVTARRIEITERVGWSQVDRDSARVHADRRAVQAEWEAGRQLVSKRGLVALDISATGCRLSGNGLAPAAGTLMRLDIASSTYGEPQWLSAEVMRVETSAFGRYLLGMRFMLESERDYARVLQWRDTSLRR